MIWTSFIAGLRNADPTPSSRSCQPYARWPAFAYRALLSLVGDCGHLSNDRTTLVGWDVLGLPRAKFGKRLSPATSVSSSRPLGAGRTRPSRPQPRGDVAGCDL